MPAYLIADIEVTDPVGYDEYWKRVPAVIAAHGASLLFTRQMRRNRPVRGGPTGAREKRVDTPGIPMTRSISVIAVMALLSSCGASAPPMQHGPGGHQSGEETAVLEAMDRYLTAISESNLAAMAAMHTSDGMTYQWRPTEGGDMHITAHPNSFWTDPSRDDGRVYRERYWSPHVMIRGGIAVVWAPYEFWIDGETSHCGVDVLDFVKKDGRWLVSNAMWTVEPGACPELRPVEGTNLRPED